MYKSNTVPGGFTLIELSIVLVIIGLIVGGVLVGQDLIRAAELRAVISDLETFNTAVNTFEGKYGCIPGDCANATQFWPLDTKCGVWPYVLNTPALSTCNGNGDGIVSSSPPTSNYGYSESFLFWQQLGLAGLIAGSYAGGWAEPLHSGGYGNDVSEPGYDVPASKIPGGCYSVIYTGPEDFYGSTFASSTMFVPAPVEQVYLFGTNLIPQWGSYDACYGGLVSPVDAHSIDSKIDDGIPSSGSVLTQYSVYGGGVNPCIIPSSVSSGTYNLSLNTPVCFLAIRTQF